MTEVATTADHLERMVSDRAATEKLDLTNDRDRARLKLIIEEHLPDSKGDAGFAESIFKNVAGYGPIQELLLDEDVWEIMINSPGSIFVKRHSKPSTYHNEVFRDDEHVSRTVTRLLENSALSHRALDPSVGLQDAQLSDGSRVHIVHRDIGRDGHMLVNIRKFNGIAYRSLDELCDTGMLTEEAASFLKIAVKSRCSIVFSGPPGCGKTTLLSCCVSESDPSLRTTIAEEVFETDISLPNVAHMQTRPPRNDRSSISLRKLVSGFLRMAPDIAVVGEVRDKEAFPFLMALSSGITGYTTIHASSANAALPRLRFVAQLSDGAQSLSLEALNALVTNSVDLVVHCARINGAPKVTEIVAIEESLTPTASALFTTTSLFDFKTSRGILERTGNRSRRIEERFESLVANELEGTS